MLKKSHYVKYTDNVQMSGFYRQLGISRTMGMKKSIVKGMGRDQVVATMVKKLADKSSTDFAVHKKRKTGYLYIYAAAVAVVLVIAIIITGRSKSQIPVSTIIASSTQNESPLLKLNNALADGKISIDQYGTYLKELLVNYDSLPQVYKTNRPVIKDTEVYGAFAEVWPRLSVGTRARITKELPVIQSKITPKKESKN